MMSVDTYGNGQIVGSTRIVDARFAGRLGGNQEFIAKPDDNGLLREQPDAVSYPIYACVYTTLTLSKGATAINRRIVWA